MVYMVKIQYQVRRKLAQTKSSTFCFSSTVLVVQREWNVLSPLITVHFYIWEHTVQCVQNIYIGMKVLVMIHCGSQFLCLDLWSLNHITCWIFKEKYILLYSSRFYLDFLSPCSCLLLFIFEWVFFLSPKEIQAKFTFLCVHNGMGEL